MSTFRSKPFGNSSLKFICVCLLMCLVLGMFLTPFVDLRHDLHPHLPRVFSPKLKSDQDCDCNLFCNFTTQSTIESGTTLPDSSTDSVTTEAAYSLPTINLNSSPNFDCTERDTPYRIAQRADKYWVLYNYIQSDIRHTCSETVTFTTQSEYYYLDNLVPLLERWQGPVSVAVFTPGYDFQQALKTVFYYRECIKSHLVKKLVTFHLFFPNDHISSRGILTQHDLALFKVDCNTVGKWIKSSRPEQTYRMKHQLDYPINVARNIARETAYTHFVLPADIELYPSPGLIESFLELIKRNEPPLTVKGRPKAPRVFVLPIFEIKATIPLPVNKSELVQELEQGNVIVFHKNFCAACHTVPNADTWKTAPIKSGLNIFHVAKRQTPLLMWEPIYIASHLEPLYDERLSWEGRKDKMSQSYQLCLLDYDFMILDNAFLIHRPGIKTAKDNSRLTPHTKAAAQTKLISEKVIPELNAIYGKRAGC